jgi:hypothetical protein
LHQISDAIGDGATYLFKPRASARPTATIDWSSDLPGKNYVGTIGGAFLVSKTPENATVRKYLDAGQNPPAGAIITYYLKDKPADLITLSFKDAQGNEIRSFKSKSADSPQPAASDTTASAEAAVPAASGTEGSGEAAVAPGAPAAKDDPTAKELKITANAGWNRFIWDLRYAPVTKIEGKDPPAEMTIEGPVIVPGTYQVALTVGDQTLTETFEVIGDPAAPASQTDVQAQFDLLMQIHQKLDATVKAVNRMRDLRQQLEGWSKRAESLENGKPIATSAKALKDKVLEIEKKLLVPDLRPGWADNFNAGVRLLEQLASLPSAIDLGNYRPTDQAHEVFKYLSAKVDAQTAQLDQLIETDLAALNKQIAEAQFGAVVPKT